jgi:AhpD family alkylhydroperoxidase
MQNHQCCPNPDRLKGDPIDCSPQQIEQCHGKDGPHACECPEIGILRNVREKEGFLPKPLVMMSKRAGLLPKFMAYAKGLFEGGPLTDRERFLIAISVSTALKSQDCMRAHTKRAKKAGATDDEIMQAVFIAGLISNTSALHLAYDPVGIFEHTGEN